MLGDDWRTCPRCSAPLEQRPRGGRPRPTCPACGFVFFANAGIGAATVIRDAAGRILMVQRARGQFAEGAWCFPCGFVEWGEDVRAAAIRETQEEAGVDVLLGDIVQVASNFHDPAKPSVGIWFAATLVDPSATPQAGDDAAAVGWFDPAAPPPLAFPTDERLLARLAADRDAVTRAAVAVIVANLQLGHEVLDVDGARLVRDRRVPLVYDANHVTAVTAATPAALDALLARMEREFAGIGHRRIDVDWTTPPGVEARLARDGWEPSDFLLMLRDGDLGSAARHDVQPVESGADWAAIQDLTDASWAEACRRLGAGFEPAVSRQLATTKRAQVPPMRYWLVRADGAPRGYVGSWPGIDGIGQVEHLFVEPGARRRGLARALLARGIADCGERGATAVALRADPRDTTKDWYARLGFRPVALRRHWLRRLPH